MTIGSEHYGEAEQLLDFAQNRDGAAEWHNIPADDLPRAQQEAAALAQVHATLALAHGAAEIRAELKDISAELTMIREALGSIDRTIDHGGSGH